MKHSMELLAVVMCVVATGWVFAGGNAEQSKGSGTMMGSSGAASEPTTGGGAMASGTMDADPAVGNRLRYAPSAAHKVIYTDLATAEQFAEQGPTVLFFAADWCPYCQADLRDINANGSRVAPDVTIVVVNYDKVPDLKTRYGVTVQDTFVQISPTGAEITAWNGGGVAALNSNIRRGAS